MRKLGFPALGAFAEWDFPIASASEIGFSRNRHDLKIAEIAVPADAAHMIEAETLNGILTVIITRSVISVRHGVGRKLYHAEGVTSTRMGFSAPVCTPLRYASDRSDHGIDVFCFFHGQNPHFFLTIREPFQ
jgi:hypothetical protein